MKVLILIAACLMALTGIGAETPDLYIPLDGGNIELLHSGADNLSMRFGVKAIELGSVSGSNGEWTSVKVENFTSTNTAGLPKLPLLRKIISVPLGARIEVTTSIETSQVLDLGNMGITAPVFPFQEARPKSNTTGQAVFAQNLDYYRGVSDTHEPGIQINEVGVLRGERLFAIDYIPIIYDARAHSLHIQSSLLVNLSFVEADHAATQALKASTASLAFESLYARYIWNHQPLQNRPDENPIGYVIILPQAFMPSMQDFIDWKVRQGYQLTVTPLESIGNNSPSIKSYMQSLWDSATPQNPAPSYLLLVGDVQQLPSNNGSTASHPTDLHYVNLEGSDYLPEMYVGRFSATSAAELSNLVNKSLSYQQYLMTDDNYLATSVLIAGVDPAYASTHCNGQINYAHEHYMNEESGFNSQVYLHPQSGAAAASIIADVSSGAGWVNYTAHGLPEGWVSPAFNVSDVLNLQNVGKPAFVVGNCCLTSKFDESLSFAEAWLRAEDKGAVVYIGSSNVSYWDEDYWWAVGAKGLATGGAPAYNANAVGLYDCGFHDHNEPYSAWATTAGELMVAGNMAVLQSNSFRINYYWEIYCIMGDPSTIPHLGIPQQNSMQVPSQLPLGLNYLELQADPYSYVALSKNSVLHGLAMADALGNVLLNFDIMDEPGTAVLVATRSRRRPVVENIQIQANTQAHVVVTDLAFDPDSDLAGAGTQFALNLQLSNLGMEAAENLSIQLSSPSPWLDILTGSAELENIPAQDILQAEALFQVAVHPCAPNQALAALQFKISNGVNEWHSQRSITIGAPHLNLLQITITDSDSDGIFEAEETLNIEINIANMGHQAAQSGSLTLVSNSALMDIPDPFIDIDALAMEASQNLYFSIILAPDVQEGSIIPLGLAFDLGGYLSGHNILIPIGAVSEGFESGDFSSFAWSNSDDYPWVIENINPNSGSYSARSGAIGHNASSSIDIVRHVGWDSEISFFYKVSSEPGVDLLKFYIDDIEMGSWGGISDWASVSFPVMPGQRIFRWTYSKDFSISFGSDCVWLDDISFPLSDAGAVPVAYCPTPALNYHEVQPNTMVKQEFVLSNLGPETLSGSINYPPQMNLFLGGESIANGGNYSLPPSSTGIFSLVYEAGESVADFEGNLMITTNDPALPEINLEINLTAAVSNENAINPSVNALYANYPNPFNPSTTISFSLKNPSQTCLSIYNLKGQLVKTLLDTELSAGTHILQWNGQDENSRPVASGVYLYRIQSPNFQSIRKMILLK
jgi:hypothetical protein